MQDLNDMNTQRIKTQLACSLLCCSLLACSVTIAATAERRTKCALHTCNWRHSHAICVNQVGVVLQERALHAHQPVRNSGACIIPHYNMFRIQTEEDCPQQRSIATAHHKLLVAATELVAGIGQNPLDGEARGRAGGAPVG